MANPAVPASFFRRGTGWPSRLRFGGHRNSNRNGNGNRNGNRNGNCNGNRNGVSQRKAGEQQEGPARQRMPQRISERKHPKMMMVGNTHRRFPRLGALSQFSCTSR
jgi:hypothetical protein